MCGGVEVGIVTERDLVEEVMRKHKDPTKVLAHKVMSSQVIAIVIDRSVGDVFEMMREKKVRRLAVVRNGKLVGIVTESRLLNSLSALV